MSFTGLLLQVMAPWELHLYSDGSTNVNWNTVGAASVLRLAGHEDTIEACSYIMAITGAEVSEHVGLACSLNVLRKWLDAMPQAVSGGVRCLLHGDNLQAWGRYRETAPLPSGAYAYSRAMVLLNKERLQQLRQAGVSLEWRHVPSPVNPAHAHAREAQQAAVKNRQEVRLHLRGSEDLKLLDTIRSTARSTYVTDKGARQRWEVQGVWRTDGANVRVAGDSAYHGDAKWARIFLCTRDFRFRLEVDEQWYTGKMSESLDTLEWDDGEMWHKVTTPDSGSV